MKGLTVVLLAVLCMSGCAYQAKVTKLNEPARAPTQDVKVFHFPPTEPFTEVATLEVDDRNGSPEAALAKKAAEIGADAIIVMGQQSGRYVAMPVGGMLIGRSLTRTQAIAIRFQPY